jgi:hypothetical protein
MIIPVYTGDNGKNFGHGGEQMTDQPDSSAPKPFDERIEESDKEEIEYSEPSDRPMRAVFPVIEGDEEKQIPVTNDFITPERIQSLQ